MIEFDQTLRYLAIGAFITGADMMLYSALTGGTVRLPRIRANIISVSCGMILGFMLHLSLVFQPQEPLLLERLLKYVVVVGISVYGVQNLVIYTLAEHWHSPSRLAAFSVRALGIAQPDDLIDRLTGKSLAAVAGVTWNFVFFKFFVYA